jgi:hypothetical protein
MDLSRAAACGLTRAPLNSAALSLQNALATEQRPRSYLAACLRHDATLFCILHAMFYNILYLLIFLHLMLQSCTFGCRGETFGCRGKTSARFLQSTGVGALFGVDASCTSQAKWPADNGERRTRRHRASACNQHARQRKRTSTAPIPSKIACTEAPGSTNAMPVYEPVVTNIPARIPPRRSAQ